MAPLLYKTSTYLPHFNGQIVVRKEIWTKEGTPPPGGPYLVLQVKSFAFVIQFKNAFKKESKKAVTFKND